MACYRGFLLRCLLVSASLVAPSRSLIVSSKSFGKLHVPRDYHPESPARITSILQHLEQKYTIVEVNDAPGQKEKALAAILGIHDHNYVNAVKIRSIKGAPYLQPYDLDTYLSPTSYECALLAQCAWLDCLNHLVDSKSDNKFAFAITRPPGHHAEHKSGEGFCIFNFAAATAVHAIQNKLVNNVAILDFDVHYGNGVSDIVQNYTDIRYASLHQMDIYPIPPKPDGILSSSPNRNILTVNLEPYFKMNSYMESLNKVVLPFLLGTHTLSLADSINHSLTKSPALPVISSLLTHFITENKPDLLIVCAGYDGLASDELASGGLQCQDYKTISEAIKSHFSGPVLFGLEGGYNLRDLPIAVAASIEPYEAT